MFVILVVAAALLAIPSLVFHTSWMVGAALAAIVFLGPIVWAATPWSRSAPTTGLRRGDTRTQVFLDDLAIGFRGVRRHHANGLPERYRGESRTYEELAHEATVKYRAGQHQEAEGAFLRLSNLVSRDDNATELIATWKRMWSLTSGRTPAYSSPALAAIVTSLDKGDFIAEARGRGWLDEEDADDESDDDDDEDDADDESDDDEDEAVGSRVSDPGLTAVEDLIAGMSIDAEWSVREERGITWWPHLTRQRIWAGRVVNVDDLRASHIRSVVPIALDVAVSPKVYELLATINMGAALGAFVYEPAERTIFLNCGAIAVNGNWDAVAMLMKTAAALQINQAESAATGLIQLVGGRPDELPHPDSGVRVSPDDMLNAATMYQQIAEAGTTFSPADLVDAARTLANMGVSTSSAATGSATFELNPRGLHGLVHCLVTSHPALGPGVLVLLETPWKLGNARAALVANDLNRLDASEWAGERRAHQLGAWTHNGGTIHYACFLPGLLAAGPNPQQRAGPIVNTVSSMVTRLLVAAPVAGGSDGRGRPE